MCLSVRSFLIFFGELLPKGIIRSPGRTEEISSTSGNWFPSKYAVSGAQQLAAAARETVNMPLYDFRIHTRQQKTERLSPKGIIVVDGILTFHDVRLREMFDIKIYVDTDADERILRRLRRDVLERGRDIDGVIEQYVTTVKPMHEIYVEPTKKYADIIVNGGKNRTALDIVSARIAELLSARD
jgi:uridine kinase